MGVNPRAPEAGRLNPLIAGLGVDVSSSNANAIVTGITEDSRRVEPGCIFVARRGGAHDGRAFIADAVRKGAVAVLTDDPLAQIPAPATRLVHHDLPGVTGLLADRVFDEPSRDVGVIAITGSNGKTTVAHFCRAMLNAAGVGCGLIGTVDIDEGDGPRPASLTTPQACDLHASLARMRANGLRAAAIEASSIGLHQGRFAGVRTRVAVFTNLTHDHLDDHGTMDEYAGAKARLFKGLDPDARAIVNADSLWMLRVCAGSRAPLMKCSMRGRLADASVLAFDAPTRAGGMRRIVLGGPWGIVHARTSLVGAHNAMNLLQAFASCWSLGADTGLLACAIESLDLPRGRMTPVDAPEGSPAIFVDFAHTPDALEKAILGAREIAGDGRVLCVFGCGGDRDRTKRPIMGDVASRLADVAIVTSDNPRTESPEAIIRDVLAGVAHKTDPDRRADVEAEPDRRAAIFRAVRLALPGDVVLIAGKGHERQQILPDREGGVTRIDFDDADVAMRAARERFTAPASSDDSPVRTPGAVGVPPLRIRRDGVASARSGGAPGETSGG